MTKTTKPAPEPVAATETPGDAEDATGVESPHNDAQSVTEGTGAEETPGDEHEEGGNREAARYRRQLREVEGERDALAGRVEALQRAEVDRQAEAAGIRPTAVWAVGTELGDLLTEDGTVDTDAVQKAIRHADDELGLTSVGVHVPSAGRQPPAHPPKDQWSDALRPR